MNTEADAYNAAVGAQIRAEAGARKISISRLAREIPIDRSTLIRYLDGERAIPIPVLYASSRVLGVDVPDLMRLATERSQRDA